MKTLLASCLLLVSASALADTLSNSAVQSNATASGTKECFVTPAPDSPDTQVVFTVTNKTFSIGETSKDNVSTTVAYDLQAIAFFRAPTSTCPETGCSEFQAAELKENPFLGTCANDDVEILVWEKFIRVDGQYFETSNPTAVHAD